MRPGPAWVRRPRDVDTCLCSGSVAQLPVEWVVRARLERRTERGRKEEEGEKWEGKKWRETKERREEGGRRKKRERGAGERA